MTQLSGCRLDVWRKVLQNANNNSSWKQCGCLELSVNVLRQLVRKKWLSQIYFWGFLLVEKGASKSHCWNTYLLEQKKLWRSIISILFEPCATFLTYLLLLTLKEFRLIDNIILRKITFWILLILKLIWTFSKILLFTKFHTQESS